ncbi:MAG: hypothetical protein H6R18_2011, partial [Proteobacteria bacterium]|nr:hypothetical protein [Pseudomonadota bacterium]
EGGQLSITARWWNLPQNILFPGGTTQTQTWDGFGRLIGQQVKSPGQAELMKRVIQYDPENNPIKIDSEQGNKQYAYDAIYRLTQADNPSGLPNERYTLDAVGNRLTDKNKPNPNQAEGQWQYNANHQLLQAATENTSFIGNNAQAINYTWDDAGNLIRKNTPAGTEAQNPTQNQRYQYDAQNRLIESQTPQGETIASYQYDPLGRRIRKTITREWDTNSSTWQLLTEAKTSLYLYAEEGLIAEYRQSGANAPQLYATHGWEPNGMWGTSPIWTRTKRSDTNEVQRFHHHNDHLGTPQKSTDASGNIVWSQKATAFGETQVDPQSLIDNPHRFPGQYYDAEINTHYNYYRTYDQHSGRYTQEDPIGLMGGINPYNYVEGGVVRYVDPKGKMTAIGVAVAIGIGITVAAITAMVISRSGAGNGKGRGDDQFDPPASNPPSLFPPQFINPCTISIGACVAKRVADICMAEEKGKEGEEGEKGKEGEEGEKGKDGQRPSKTPNTGTPGSTVVNPGSGQERTYGPDGLPERDVDRDHDHGQGVPHAHDWVDGKRGPGVPVN